MPTVTIREATVQTVQIEIKALKVGKKQVTMGLFRQLPLAMLVDPDTAQLQGIPWGHVLYWWDGDRRPSVPLTRLLHVVWQDGDTLRRAIVDQEPPQSTIHAFQSALETCRKHFFFLTLLDDSTMRVVTQQYHAGAVWADVVYQEKKIRLILQDLKERDILESFATDRTNVHCQEDYHALLTRLDIAHTLPQEWTQRFLDTSKARDTYVARWKKQVDALHELPQLFIAV